MINPKMITDKYKTIYQELKTERGTLRGFLTEPENKKNIVVMLHGFTGHKNENGFLFKQIASSIASIDYASLRFDFMGSGDSDGDYIDMTFLTEVEDAKTIIDYAYELNGNKPIILLGFSMGGAVAGYVAKIKEEKIAKLILMAPAGCMDEHASRCFENAPKIDDNSADIGGFCIGKKYVESFNNIDLYCGVASFNRPVIIIHGGDDQAVPIEYGMKYNEQYSDSSFHKIDGASHCFTKVEYRNKVQELIIEFLNK